MKYEVDKCHKLLEIVKSTKKRYSTISMEKKYINSFKFDAPSF